MKKFTPEVFRYAACLLCLVISAEVGASGFGESSYPLATSTAQAANQPGLFTVTNTNTGAAVILGGSVVPYRTVTLSAQLPGQIRYLAGIEGDWFEAGELLVAVDDDELRARRQQALAEIGNSAYDMSNAQVQYGKEFMAPQSRDIGKMPGMGLPSLFDQFFTRNVGSGMGYGNPWLERQADLYSYRSRLGKAQGQHWGAYSRLQEVEAKLRDSRSVAPFTGVIVSKLVEQGDIVQPGQPLLHFADTRDLQLRIEVPARLMRSLRRDMVVPAVLDVGDRHVNARVAQIFPVADTARHTVTVKFDLPIGVPAAPGMYAEVMVPDADAPIQSLPMIPASAILWRGSLPAVFVLGQNNKTELRLIRLGESVGDNHVTVLSGIRSGEQVVAAPPAGMSSSWKSDSNDTAQ